MNMFIYILSLPHGQEEINTVYSLEVFLLSEIDTPRWHNITQVLEKENHNRTALVGDQYYDYHKIVYKFSLHHKGSNSLF